MLKTLCLAAAAAALLGGTASAATLTFGPGNWDYNERGEVPWLVTIDDAVTAGKWTVTVSASAGPGTDTGSIRGVGFDTALTGLTADAFGFVSSNTGEEIDGIYADSRDCGSGCNFNGALKKPDSFDWILAFGSPGASDGLLTDLSFTIDTDAALAANSIGRVGIRAQSVGAHPTGGNSSSKDLNMVGVYDAGTPPPAPVPLPAAAWLLGAGLATLAGTRRLRRA